MFLRAPFSNSRKIHRPARILFMAKSFSGFPRMGLVVFMLAWIAMPLLSSASSIDKMRRSLVKIYVTIQRYDYTQPWQAASPNYASGSGFIIDKRRILTNAHVVSDAAFIEVQRDGDAHRYPARVALLAHDCDLAIITVDDTDFFQDTEPVVFGESIPQLSDEVMVLGYPMGGVRLSLTRGVVSRIDYNIYSHSGADAHLVMQTDAAINPGNSGGPVIFDNHVVGVAFQCLLDSQNIGYAIPLPVIQHMLRDAENGAYHGYPELGVFAMDVRNPALRRALSLPPVGGGKAVVRIDPFGAAYGFLKEGDVLLRVEKHAISTDGTVLLDGAPVDFSELVERRQWGETVSLDVSRHGQVQSVDVPLRNPEDPFCYRMQYNEPPEYYIIGGLVFEPISRNLLVALGNDLDNRAVHGLFYLSTYAKIDHLIEDRKQFIVLANRLPHSVNTYDEAYRYGVVVAVNGRKIGSMQDLSEAFAHPDKGFHVIHFEGRNDPLVLDAAITREADTQIRTRYAIPGMSRIR